MSMEIPSDQDVPKSDEGAEEDTSDTPEVEQKAEDYGDNDFSPDEMQVIKFGRKNSKNHGYHGGHLDVPDN